VTSRNMRASTGELPRRAAPHPTMDRPPGLAGADAPPRIRRVRTAPTARGCVLGVHALSRARCRCGKLLSAEAERTLSPERIERRLSAILAADVAGYSRLTGLDEEGTHIRLRDHLRLLVDPKVAEHHGRVVKSTGDGMLAEFGSVVDAVRCALEVQRGMMERNADVQQERRINFRIGINVGDIIIDCGDIFGDGVNVAVRLQGVAEPGGICISDDAHRHVRGKLDITFEDAGEQMLKNIARPVRAYKVAVVAEKIHRDVVAGERKHLTVLCANLKESLERVAQRDPEEALKIFEVVLPLMTQAVHRYEGMVNVVTGDGIMALFGVPLTQEDHAVRACYAALQIQEAVRRRYAPGLQRVAEIPILVRAGLNSGEVVIRPIANGGRTECHAMGQTIHLADRLGQIAAPGTLLIGAETLRLAEGHVRVRALESVNLTGQGDPVYELVDARPAQTRFQALAARGLTGFVGRRAEMEQLERVQARAEQRHGQVVTIIGEPGLGKSRLLHEYLRSHRTSHWLVLQTASVSYRTATSYQPVIDLLQIYFKIEVS